LKMEERKKKRLSDDCLLYKFNASDFVRSKVLKGKVG